MPALDSNTKLLLHCDGTDGSTTITDSSLTPKTVTAGGGAVIDNDVVHYSQTLSLNGTTAYAYTTHATDFEIAKTAATSWSWEAWVKHTDHAGTEIYFSKFYASDSQYYITFSHVHGTGLQFKVVDADSTIILLEGGEITDTNWHHVAIIKKGQATPDWGIYKDGTQVAYAADNSTLDLGSLAPNFYIGAGYWLPYGGVFSAFDGAMDEIRVYEGNYYSAAPNVGLSNTISVPTEPFESSTVYSETSIGTATSGAGNGAAYYNNYIYFATPTDISRYGPLDGSPSLTNTVWTGSTLGTQTAMVNTTYPTFRGAVMPNHPMHVHTNNCLYVGDYANGQGLIHKIKTTKVTAEGDTNDSSAPSAYAVLRLMFGYYPTDIESYGTDLVILAIPTTNTVLVQGKAALFFWDTTSASYYRFIPLPDPIGTALYNNNGVLNIFSGNATNGVRISEYIGGDSVRTVTYLEEGTPPFAGAVDVIGDKLFFGSWTSYPESSACVYAFGSKRSDLPQALSCPVRTSSTGLTPTATAVKAVLQADNISPQVIAGWGDASAKGLDKKSADGTFASVWRSERFNVGRKFNIVEIRMPLGKTLVSGMTLVPKIYLDDDTSSVTLTTINSTNFSGQKVIYRQPELSSAIGTNNFLLELNWEGTVNLPVIMPIEILVDINEDEE